MKREDVYKLIDAEREYQNNQSRPKSDAETTAGEWVIYIQHQLHLAHENIYHLREQDAMENIRKIAGLAVAAMEHIETPGR